MTADPRLAGAPRLTACALCAGETLEGVDPLPGGQRARLDRLVADGVTRVTYVECLDECERGDVVVARPSAAQRARGTGPVWLERIAGDALTAELERWLRAGGPGACPVPMALAAHRIALTGEPPAEPSAGHGGHDHAGHATGPASGVVDPVCGMTVDPATAVATVEHEGTTHHFCAKACRKAFLAAPAQYV